jgi:hypothetical protein
MSITKESVMDIQVRRTTFTNLSTVGEMWIDGQFECYTLEDCTRQVLGQPVAAWKIANSTAIPIGQYTVTIDQSARFGQLMPHVLNVPGFEGVRIHWGNTDKDTEGCILVGQEKTTDFIGHSRAAFAEFFPKLQAAMSDGGATITVTGLPDPV